MSKEVYRSEGGGSDICCQDSENRERRAFRGNAWVRKNGQIDTFIIPPPPHSFVAKLKPRLGKFSAGGENQDPA